ncbi:MAG: hypothetical protein AABY18_02045 [Candidatus Thermoplasmatota archaeon]
MNAKLPWAAVLFAVVTLAGCSDSPDASAALAPEPSRVEERVFLTLDDDFMADSSGAKGPTFHVTAGKTVGLHVQNEGAVVHEVMFGRNVETEDGMAHGYGESLFENVGADVFVYQPAKTEVATEHGLAEIEVGAGGQVWIRAMFPAEMKGTWEIGCFVPGHFEEGMKATLIIE